MNARREAEIEADDTLVEVLKAAALKMDALMSGDMKLRADELAAAITAVKDRSESDMEVGCSLTDVCAWFPRYLDRACASLIVGGRAYSKVLDDKKFSAWADNIQYAMTRRRRSR